MGTGRDCIAQLALAERSAPAAAGGKTTREFWVIAVGGDPARADMRIAYAIVATVTGNEAAAKDELIQSIKGWRLPGLK